MDVSLSMLSHPTKGELLHPSKRFVNAMSAIQVVGSLKRNVWARAGIYAEISC